VLAIVGEVEKATLTPWEDKVSAQVLLPKAPKAGRITKEVKREAIGVTEWTLSNGARVIVKPTDFEADSVVLLGSSPGGEAGLSDKDYLELRWTTDLVEVGGIGGLDVETLGKLLTGKRVAVSTTIGDSTEAIQGVSSGKDLETLFQLLYLRMTAPRRDEQAIAVWKADARESLVNAQRSPEYRIRRESEAALYRNHPRLGPPAEGDFAKIDVDRVFRFYQDRFGDATDFTFIVVGSVELAKLRPFVETYLASLPAKGRREKEKDLGIRKIGGVVKKEWKLASEPRAAVHLDFHGKQKWSRDAERDMAILSEVLSGRLRGTMREDMGGVYGVGAEGQVSRISGERSFTVSFSCEPQRAPELIQAVMDTIEELKTEDVDAAELAAIEQGFLRSREVDLKTNRFWLGWLTRAYRFGDDPTLVLDTKGMIGRMTPARVKAAAKRYLDAKQLYQAVVLPAK
jgi:zinc protease